MSDDHMLALGRDQMIALLSELGSRLDEQGVQARLFVVGGAAMALAFNSRRLTADIDGVFEPKAKVYEAADQMAHAHGLPPDWLNDGVKGLLPGPDPEARVLLDVPGLSLSVPSPRYLLALKVASARFDRDLDDIKILADACGARDAEQVLQIAEEVMGEGNLPRKSQFAVMELFPPGPVNPERPTTGSG
ncbi:MAG: nucleotidyltransferase [Propionibacteriaceae bacterium]|nr:nucleotidyltransferase [Propionibacteriaceae bacterium]